MLFPQVVATIGAAVLAGSTAMLRPVSSRAGSGGWASWTVPLVVAGGIVGATGAGDSGTVHDLADPLTGPPVALFWLWMIASSIVLFRRASRGLVGEQRR